jgi:hypothetical protein
MLEPYLMKINYVGPPAGDYKRIVQKKHDMYFVIWYLQGRDIRYNVSGPPVLIAATALLAEKANQQIDKDFTQDIIRELKLPETLHHHVFFTQKALIKLVTLHH